MKITNGTNFHWRNVLKPTPTNVFWIFLTAEAVLLGINIDRIAEGSPKWVIITLTSLQVVVGKMVLFFGKIKDEYEKEIITTVKSETPITVETETLTPPK